MIEVKSQRLEHLTIWHLKSFLELSMVWFFGQSTFWSFQSILSIWSYLLGNSCRLCCRLVVGRNYSVWIYNRNPTFYSFSSWGTVRMLQHSLAFLSLNFSLPQDIVYKKWLLCCQQFFLQELIIMLPKILWELVMLIFNSVQYAYFFFIRRILSNLQDLFIYSLFSNLFLIVCININLTLKVLYESHLYQFQGINMRSTEIKIWH